MSSTGDATSSDTTTSDAASTDDQVIDTQTSAQSDPVTNKDSPAMPKENEPGHSIFGKVRPHAHSQSGTETDTNNDHKERQYLNMTQSPSGSPTRAPVAERKTTPTCCRDHYSYYWYDPYTYGCRPYWGLHWRDDWHLYENSQRMFPAVPGGSYNGYPHGSMYSSPYWHSYYGGSPYYSSAYGYPNTPRYYAGAPWVSEWNVPLGSYPYARSYARPYAAWDRTPFQPRKNLPNTYFAPHPRPQGSPVTTSQNNRQKIPNNPVQNNGKTGVSKADVPKVGVPKAGVPKSTKQQPRKSSDKGTAITVTTPSGSKKHGHSAPRVVEQTAFALPDRNATVQQSDLKENNATLVVLDKPRDTVSYPTSPAQLENRVRRWEARAENAVRAFARAGDRELRETASRSDEAIRGWAELTATTLSRASRSVAAAVRREQTENQRSRAHFETRSETSLRDWAGRAKRSLQTFVKGAKLNLDQASYELTRIARIERSMRQELAHAKQESSLAHAVLLSALGHARRLANTTLRCVNAGGTLGKCGRGPCAKKAACKLNCFNNCEGKRQADEAQHNLRVLDDLMQKVERLETEQLRMDMNNVNKTDKVAELMGPSLAGNAPIIDSLPILDKAGTAESSIAFENARTNATADIDQILMNGNETDLAPPLGGKRLTLSGDNVLGHAISEYPNIPRNGTAGTVQESDVDDVVRDVDTVIKAMLASLKRNMTAIRSFHPASEEPVLEPPLLTDSPTRFPTTAPSLSSPPLPPPPVFVSNKTHEAMTQKLFSRIQALQADLETTKAQLAALPDSHAGTRDRIVRDAGEAFARETAERSLNFTDESKQRAEAFAGETHGRLRNFSGEANARGQNFAGEVQTRGHNFSKETSQRSTDFATEAVERAKNYTRTMEARDAEFALASQAREAAHKAAMDAAAEAAKAMQSVRTEHAMAIQNQSTKHSDMLATQGQMHNASLAAQQAAHEGSLAAKEAKHDEALENQIVTLKAQLKRQQESFDRQLQTQAAEALKQQTAARQAAEAAILNEGSRARALAKEWETAWNSTSDAALQEFIKSGKGSVDQWSTQANKAVEVWNNKLAQETQKVRDLVRALLVKANVSTAVLDSIGNGAADGVVADTRDHLMPLTKGTTPMTRQQNTLWNSVAVGSSDILSPEERERAHKPLPVAQSDANAERDFWDKRVLKPKQRERRAEDPTEIAAQATDMGSTKDQKMQMSEASDQIQPQAHADGQALIPGHKPKNDPTHRSDTMWTDAKKESSAKSDHGVRRSTLHETNGDKISDIAEKNTKSGDDNEHLVDSRVHGDTTRDEASMEGQSQAVSLEKDTIATSKSDTSSGLEISDNHSENRAVKDQQVPPHAEKDDSSTKSHDDSASREQYVSTSADSVVARKSTTGETDGKKRQKMDNADSKGQDGAISQLGDGSLFQKSSDNELDNGLEAAFARLDDLETKSWKKLDLDAKSAA